MNPTSHFKMVKSTKTMLAFIKDPHERGRFRRAMVHAQMAGEEGKKYIMSLREKHED